MKKFSGFTLVELLITVGIAGILMAIASPNLSQFIQNERLTSATNSLLTDIMLARSKAVERNQPVTICASSNQASCTNDGYEEGWIVAVDTDNDGTGDEIIKIQQAIDGNVTYDQGAGLSVISFDSRGFLPTGASTGTISICDNRTNPNDYAKTISLSATGRVSRGANPAC